MNKTARKLRALADRMTAQIEKKRDPAIGERNWTRRRAAIAASMAQDADRLERVQYALYALADAHEAGTISPLLGDVLNKATVEALVTFERWPPWDDQVKRMHKAGLTPETYEEARRELLDMAQPPDRSEERRRRELENDARRLVGQIPGYFPTPPEVIRKMFALADLGHDGLRVLEPSAGAGHIADALREAAREGWTVHAVEFAVSLRELLEMKGHELVGSDFLDFRPVRGYDRVVMNPPFEQGQDIEHVRHAYECLAPGGRLVSVMCESAFFRNGSAAEFRDWLDEVGGWDVDLPAGAFESSGTGVKARLVVMDKPGQKREEPMGEWAQMPLELAGAPMLPGLAEAVT